jgi:hypothetical protein
MEVGIRIKRVIVVASSWSGDGFSCSDYEIRYINNSGWQREIHTMVFIRF